MSTTSTRKDQDAPVDVNEVRLVGRLATEPEERTLPSGDAVVSLRVVVRRAPGTRRPGSPSIDALDCSAFTAAARRAALRWSAGDVVEVTGRLRRRFQRAQAGPPTSRWDVEVTSARRLQRAPDAPPAQRRAAALDEGLPI